MGVRSTRDPRPDMVQDTLHWDTLLHVATSRDDQPAQPRANLLHGLRCGGASLEVRPNGSWKLNYDTALAYLQPYQQEQWKQELSKHRTWYTEVFKAAAELYGQAATQLKSA